MSKRPIEVKQRRKVAKAFRRTPDAYFDLVQYLVDQRHASTRTKARKLILDRRVKSDSHVLGCRTAMVPVARALGNDKIEEKEIVAPHVSVKLRGNIQVSA